MTLFCRLCVFDDTAVSFQITDEGCHRLINALGPLRALSTLDLSHNPFGSKGCHSIANLLCQPGCLLRSLFIAGCLYIHPGAWKTISAREVETMRYDSPRPGDDGAVVLAAALISPHGCPLRWPGNRIRNAFPRRRDLPSSSSGLRYDHNTRRVCPL